MDLAKYKVIVMLCLPNLRQAIEKFGDIDVYTSTFRPMKATLSGLPEKTFMKIIVEATSDKVIGMHMCGDETPEILQVPVIILGLTQILFC